MASHASIKKLTFFEYVFLIVVLVYALWSLVRIGTTTIPDFSVLYHSAQNLLSGTSLYRDSRLYTGLGYPAVSLVPYIPFTVLPYTAAAWVWIVGSFISYLMVIYLSLRLVGNVPVRSWALLSAIGFLAFPTKFTFGMGQVNFIALALLLTGISSMHVTPALRVVVLILSLLFKPHFIFVYLGLLFTQHRKYIMASFIGLVFVILCVGIITHWAPDKEYIRDMVPNLLEYRGREIYFNQGIGGFISRLFGTDSANLTYVAIFVVLFSSVFALAKRELNASNMLAVLLPMQVLIEPLAWQHHLVFLFPTFVLLWFNATIRGGWVKTFLILCFLLIGWNIKNPLYWQGNMLASLVLSHGFIGCLMLWYMAIRFI